MGDSKDPADEYLVRLAEARMAILATMAREEAQRRAAYEEAHGQGRPTPEEGLAILAEMEARLRERAEPLVQEKLDQWSELSQLKERNRLRAKEAEAHRTKLPDSEFVYVEDLVRALGVSKSTIDRMVKEKLLPAKVQVTARRKGWRHTDMKAWLDARQGTSSAAKP